MICARCGSETGVETPLRRDECPACGADLHACVHCAHYAPGHYNDCREPQAERVLDTERANFCDYFRPGAGKADDGPATDPKAAARAKLDALFGKKS